MTTTKRALALTTALALTVLSRAASAQDDAGAPTEDAAVAIERDSSPVPVPADPPPGDDAPRTRAADDTTTEPPPDPTIAERIDPPPPTLLSVPSGEGLGDIAAPRATTGVPWAIEPGLQLFGEYRLTLTDDGSGGTDWFHEFDLPRAWVWVSFRIGDVIARVLVEGTRSGGEGALIGVAGDSIVVRFREAWVGYRLLDMLEMRVGLIPQLVTPALASLWGMRAVSAIALRSFGSLELMQPADLGVSLRFDLPEGFGTFQAAYLDGEGYRSRERNRGKSLELMAQIHPLASLDGAQPLTVTLGYQMGSTGVGSARADRVVGALAWADPRWGVGLETSWILGIEDRGDREGVMIDAWGRAEPFDDVPLLVGARAAHFVLDTQTASTSGATTLTMTVGARIAQPLRAFVAVDGRFADEAFASANPGFERWALRVVVEGDLAGRFEGSF